MTAFFFSMILPLTLAGSAVTLILLALTPLSRTKFTSRWQYYSWIVALILFAVPVTALLPAQTIPISPVFPPLTAIAEGLADMAEPPMLAEPALRFFLPWREVLAMVWVAGIVIYLYRQFLFAARFHQALRRVSRAVTASETVALFRRCCTELDVRRKIKLRTCPPACAPMLVGILHPCIILPELPLNTEDLRLVFLHELTHYRHGDLPYKFAALLIGAVHWFNPLARLVSERLETLCELACDETLSRKMEPEERRRYGMAILSVMGEAHLSPPISTSFSLTKQDIKRRITLIMDYKRPTRGLIATGICSIALMTFVGVSVSAYVLPESRKIESSTNRKIEPVTIVAPENKKSDILSESTAVEQTTVPVLLPDSSENPFSEKIDLPVKDAQLTARFGAYFGHTGADFSDSGIFGREIYAVADGTLVKSEFIESYGNYIVLDHGNGVQTRYAMCNELKVKMREDGEPVTIKKGDVIATVGRTGLSTGPHLHFEVLVKGKPIDPELCLK